MCVDFRMRWAMRSKAARLDASNKMTTFYLRLVLSDAVRKS